MSESTNTGADYIRRLVGEAPAPDAEQLERLRALLRPASDGDRT